MSLEGVSALMGASVTAAVSEPKRAEQAGAAAVEPRSPQSADGARQVDEADFAGKVRNAVDELNRALQAARRELRFTVHESTGKTVVKVIAPDSGDVVRQIPSVEALKLAERLRAGGALGSLGVDGHS